VKEAGFRRLTATWPGVTHDVKWDDDLVASVGGKMFAVYCIGGAHRGRIGFKVADELFLALTEQPGIIPAPYAARFKWISLTEPERYEDAWIGNMIRRSYALVAGKLPKKIRRELGLAD
jgi:predicted DNA-binding protein (MmcQ/YjbR family)